jgi:hypothetical protein
MRTVCHVHITMLTVKCHGLLAVGAFLGWSPPFLDFLAIFGEANSSYCEFSGVFVREKEEESVMAISRARGNHS